MNSHSPLALTHNDDAVLERHHAHTAFTVLFNKSSAMLEGLTKEDRLAARKLVCLHACANGMIRIEMLAVACDDMHYDLTLEDTVAVLVLF